MPQLSREELDDIYAFAINLGKSAGKILLDAAKLRYGDDRPEERAHIEKENAVDLVTQTDEGKKRTPFFKCKSYWTGNSFSD